MQPRRLTEEAQEQNKTWSEREKQRREKREGRAREKIVWQELVGLSEARWGPLNYFCLCFWPLLHLAVFMGLTWLSTQVHEARTGKLATFHTAQVSSNSHQKALVSRAQCIFATGWKEWCKSDPESTCNSSLHLHLHPCYQLSHLWGKWLASQTPCLSFFGLWCPQLSASQDPRRASPDKNQRLHNKVGWPGGQTGEWKEGCRKACQGRTRRVVIYRTWHSLPSRLACEPAEFPSGSGLGVLKLSGYEQIGTSGHSDSTLPNVCHSLLWREESGQKPRCDQRTSGWKYNLVILGLGQPILLAWGRNNLLLLLSWTQGSHSQRPAGTSSSRDWEQKKGVAVVLGSGGSRRAAAHRHQEFMQGLPSSRLW